MILLSVGTQLPFDRLVRTVDAWALSTGRTDVIAQTGPSAYQPQALKCFPFLSPQEFRNLQETAAVHVAHAGMGSILTAMELGKPILIMPRDHTRGEHRNAHQLATAKRFAGKSGVRVSFTEQDLLADLENIDALAAPEMRSGKAPDDFILQLRAFIEGGAIGPGGG